MNSQASDRLGSGEMFDRIAPGYDRLNRILSLGVDRGWRRRMVRSLAVPAGGRVLDLATGTADVALAIASAYPGCTVIGTDPSQRMLSLGRQKVEQYGLTRRVELLGGDAESIEADDDSFDAVTMAFGIRNVPDRARALREMARVVRPGGRVAVLELTEPRGLLAPLARFHVHWLVPRIGALLSGAQEYRYLHESIEAFPAAAQFAHSMRENGFDPPSVERLTFGACHLFVAEPATRTPFASPAVVAGSIAS